jgi:hypothetical protein
VVELVDARDSKSRGLYACVSSILTSGTNEIMGTTSDGCPLFLILAKEKMNSNLPLITYYDIDNIDALSYYLSGFQLNQMNQRCRFKIVRRPPRFFEDPKFHGDWRQLLFVLGIFKFQSNGKEYHFCIDRGDHSSNKMNEGYHLPLLEHVHFYFKTNFNAFAIAADREVNAYLQKIIPILPSFPIRVPRRLPLLPRSMQMKKIRARMKNFFKLPTLNDYRRWRLCERDLDVFFLLVYYNRSHHQDLNQFRAEIMRVLAKHRHLKFSMGFVSNKVLPENVTDLQRARLGMKEYLTQLARSKVAIYVRGPHDGISSKFGQYMAMAKPIVGQTLANNRERLYNFPNFNRQFGYDDPEQIAKRVIELLERPDEMNQLARSNATTYDRYLHPENVVSEILEHLK